MPDAPPILRDEVLRAAIAAATDLTTTQMRNKANSEQGLMSASEAGAAFVTVFGSVHQCILAWYASPASEVLPLQPPAYDVDKSITPEFIYSLEDGKGYKTLTRHLNRIGLTPDTYRAKWGLPKDYPMSAPEFSKRRSDYAKNSGLGQRPPKASATAKAAG